MTDHLVRMSSGSADASALDAVRTTEMPNSFTSSQDLAGLDQINAGLHSSPYPRPPQLPFTTLFEWYHKNDGPWTGLTPSQVNAGPSSAVGNLRANPLFQYRDNVPPSEGSTILPSDSGYASYGAKHSVTNNSVCDESFDRNTETQSVIGHMSELSFPTFGPELLPRNGLDHANLRQLVGKFGDHRSQLNASAIVCKTCDKVLKTNSELKKHTQRHTKPYRCDVSGCTRREGFSTSNDLDRHKRSVHPDAAAAGNRYTCPMPSCKSRGKIWPRADNFRAHLKRVHSSDASDEELEKYVVLTDPSRKPPPTVISDLARENTNTKFPHFSPFPSGANDTSGRYWQIPQNEIIELSNEANPIENSAGSTHTNDSLILENASRDVPPLPKSDSSVSSAARQDTDLSLDPPRKTAEEISSRDLQVDNQGDYIQPATLIKSNTILPETRSFQSEVQECRSSPPRDEIRDNPTESCGELDDLSMDADSLGALNEIKEIERGTRDSSESDNQQNVKPGLHSVDLNDQTEVGRLLETLQSNGLLRLFGYKKESSSMELDSKDLEETSSKSNQDHPHPCAKCSKTFNRRCELRKHEKRHAKPYGCTFPSCTKSFGSKNDWKRHENSQHFQLDVWRCDVQRSEFTEVCGKVSNKRESFCAHLQASHGIYDRKTLESKIECCRIGRNYETRFWCGFCEAIVENKEKGLGAWNERFDHIDNHFIGKNGLPRKEINEWVDMNPDQSSKDLSAPDSDGFDRSSSPPSTALTKSDTEHAEKSSKRATQPLKPNGRKKAVDSDGRVVKRRRQYPILEIKNRFLCCQCGDLMPETNHVCTNLNCDHKQCKACEVAG